MDSLKKGINSRLTNRSLLFPQSPTEKKIKVSKIQINFQDSHRTPTARLTNPGSMKKELKINSILKTNLLLPAIKYSGTTKSTNRSNSKLNYERLTSKSYLNPSPSIFHRSIEKNISQLIKNVEQSTGHNSHLLAQSKRLKKLFDKLPQSINNQ